MGVVSSKCRSCVGGVQDSKMIDDALDDLRSLDPEALLNVVTTNMLLLFVVKDDKFLRNACILAAKRRIRMNRYKENVATRRDIHCEVLDFLLRHEDSCQSNMESCYYSQDE